MEAEDSIQVFIRVKPQPEQQSSVQFTDTEIKLEKHQFAFDRIFDPSCSQEDIFSSVGTKLLENVMDGYNSCVFAYGQTGSGKTHTMIGDNNGLMQQSFRDLFSRINMLPSAECLVTCSYFELYNEQIMDLLDPKKQRKLSIRHDLKKGAFVENLTEETALDVEKLMEVLHTGMKNRHIGETQMNRESSRSHSVFTISLSCKVEEDGKQVLKTPKLHFVDLAGSERQKMTMASGDRLKEAGNINKSLTTLGMVINALTSEKPRSHIPYRDSKLTYLLRDSLGGNSKTFIIATISSSVLSFQETLSTLNFANRAKMVKVSALINEESLSSNIEVYKDQIRRLKSEIIKLKSQERRTPLKIIQSPSQDFMPVSKFVATKPALPTNSDYEKHFQEINSKINAISEQIRDGVVSPSLETMIEVLRKQKLFPSDGHMDEELKSENQSVEQSQRGLTLGADFAEYLNCNYQLLSEIHKKLNDYVEAKEDLRNAAMNKKLTLEHLKTPSKFERDQYEELLQRREEEIKLLEERVESCVSQLNVKSLENRQLQRKVSHLSEQKGEETEEIAYYKDACTKTEQQLELQKFESHKLKLIAQKCQKGMEELENRLRQTKQLYLYSEEKYENEKFNSQKMASQQDSMETEIKQLKKQLGSLKEQLKTAENHAKGIRVELEDAEAREEQLKRALSEAEQAVEYNKKLLGELGTKNDALETEKKQTKMALEALSCERETQIKQLQQQLSSCQSDLKMKSQGLECLKEKLQGVSELNTNMSQQVRAMQISMEEARLEFTQALSQERMKSSLLNEEFNKKTSEIERIKNQKHNQSLQNSRDIAQKQRALEILSTRLESKSVQLQTLESTFQKSRTDFTELVQQLKMRNSQTDNLNQELNQKLTSAERCAAERQSRVASLEETLEKTKGMREENQQLKKSYKEAVKENYRLKGKYQCQSEELWKGKNEQLISKVEFYEEKFKLMSIEYEKAIQVVKRLKQKELKQNKKIQFYEESNRLNSMAQEQNSEEMQFEQASLLNELKRENRELKAKMDNLESNLPEQQGSYKLSELEGRLRQKLINLMRKWDGLREDSEKSSFGKSSVNKHQKPERKSQSHSKVGCEQKSTEELIELWELMAEEKNNKFESICKGIKREQKLKSQNHFILKENIHLKERLSALEARESQVAGQEQIENRPRKAVKVD